jgi:hypothetical protein
MWTMPLYNTLKIRNVFLISNFCCVLKDLFFLLGDSPATEFYVPIFRNTVSVPGSVSRMRSRLFFPLTQPGKDSVLKCQHLKFRCQGITHEECLGKNLCTMTREHIIYTVLIHTSWFYVFLEFTLILSATFIYKKEFMDTHYTMYIK